MGTLQKGSDLLLPGIPFPHQVCAQRERSPSGWNRRGCEMQDEAPSATRSEACLPVAKARSASACKEHS